MGAFQGFEESHREPAAVCTRLGVAGLLDGGVSSERSGNRVTKQLEIASSCPGGRASDDCC